MTNAAKGWLAFGIVAMCGVMIAACAISNTAASPRSFLRDHYQCSPDPTEVDLATCDDDADPQDVVDEISKDVQPIDTETDNGDSGGYLDHSEDPLDDSTDPWDSEDPLDDSTDPWDSEDPLDDSTDPWDSEDPLDDSSDSYGDSEDEATYMQYEDDIVVVSSKDGRTEIEVDDYESAYHRHHTVIGGFGWGSTGGGWGGRGGGGGGGGFGGK